MPLRLGIVVAALATTGVIVGFFVTRFLNPTPAPIVATSTAVALQGHPVVNVELTTVGAIGSGPHPNWVAYLPTTYIDVPPGAVVHMTIIQEDSATGVRNPYFSLTRGTINNETTVNGKVFKALDPSLPAHTFTIPDLGINVPLDGLGSNASANARPRSCPSARLLASPAGVFLERRECHSQDRNQTYRRDRGAGCVHLRLRHVRCGGETRAGHSVWRADPRWEGGEPHRASWTSCRVGLLGILVRALP